MTSLKQFLLTSFVLAGFASAQHEGHNHNHDHGAMTAKASTTQAATATVRNPTTTTTSSVATETSIPEQYLTAAKSLLSLTCAKTEGAGKTTSCEMYNKLNCTASNNTLCSNPVTFGYSLCNELTSSNAFGNTTTTNDACTTLKSYCNSTASANATCNAYKIPSTKKASEMVYSICFEMPNMVNCGPCPTPDTKTGISNCSVLKNYGDLCIEMSGMGQCAEWKSFCSSINDKTSFCSLNSTSDDAGTGSSTDRSKNNAIMATHSLGLMFIASAFLFMI